MSINRASDLDTSLSRTDGVHHKYLNLSSSDRNKVLYPDSSDAELSFDDQSNVLSMKILNFEIPHTRYAIDKKCNNLYMSEKRGEDEYHFYSLRGSTGGHSVQNLGVSLTLSAQCPVMFNGDEPMQNEYTFHVSLLYGKVGVVSSGECDFSIHTATETVTLSSIAVRSDTEAIVSFLAPVQQIFKPGALLVFRPHTYPDRDVQVVETITTGTGNEVRVIGDFSDMDWESLDVSLSQMMPYSAVNSVANIMGFGESDLSGHSEFELLSVGSPFVGEDLLLQASVMVCTNFTPFLQAGDYVHLSGIPGFMNGMVCQVAIVHDEAHAEIYVNRSALWEHESGKIVSASNPDSEWDVSDIQLSSVNDNSVTLAVSLDDTSADPSTISLVEEDVVQFSGFVSPEFGDLDATVVSVDERSSSGSVVTISFDYPTRFLFEDGVSKLTPVDPDTTLRTTYITPHRFDLSRGRRVVLCRAVVDNQDVGSIHIPRLSTRAFFGRIQLFSGADLVNFLNKDTAYGAHEFNSVLKRLNKIRFQFVNEDGSAYDFVGVDYTMFLELTCLDSNRGL